MISEKSCINCDYQWCSEYQPYNPRTGRLYEQDEKEFSARVDKMAEVFADYALRHAKSSPMPGTSAEIMKRAKKLKLDVLADVEAFRSIDEPEVSVEPYQCDEVKSVRELVTEFRERHPHHKMTEVASRLLATLSKSEQIIKLVLEVLQPGVGLGRAPDGTYYLRSESTGGILAGPMSSLEELLTLRVGANTALESVLGSRE